MQARHKKSFQWPSPCRHYDETSLRVGFGRENRSQATGHRIDAGEKKLGKSLVACWIASKREDAAFTCRTVDFTLSAPDSLSVLVRFAHFQTPKLQRFGPTCQTHAAIIFISQLDHPPLLLFS